MRIWAEVDLDAVRHNVRVVCGVLKHGAALMAVVKSEAYGHGSVEVAKAALSAGANCLGVSDIREGLILRESGITAPIQVLYSSLPEEMDAGIEDDLTFSVSSKDEICELADRSRAIQQGERRGRRTRVHMFVDTGMGRGGFSPEEVWPAVTRILAEKTLELEGIFTHFSSAEEPDATPTADQVRLFRKLNRYCSDRKVRIRVRHAANSAGAIFHPDAHLDMVRCGIILHGIRAWPTSRDGLELRPSLSLMTRIVHIGRRPAGWTVGYNRLHVCHKESLLATLPVGYADGYRRALTGRSVVIIRGVQVPVVGSVSMNCIVVDITALENSTAGLPQVGEKAILIGSAQETRISVEDIAELSGTIPYVVTTQLGSNIERRYLNIQSPAQVDIQKQSCLEGTQANLLEDQAFELRRVVIPSAIPLHRTTPELESTPLLEARPAGRIIHIASA